MGADGSVPASGELPGGVDLAGPEVCFDTDLDLVAGLHDWLRFLGWACVAAGLLFMAALYSGGRPDHSARDRLVGWAFVGGVAAAGALLLAVTSGTRCYYRLDNQRRELEYVRSAFFWSTRRQECRFDDVTAVSIEASYHAGTRKRGGGRTRGSRSHDVAVETKSHACVLASIAEFEPARCLGAALARHFNVSCTLKR